MKTAIKVFSILSIIGYALAAIFTFVGIGGVELAVHEQVNAGGIPASDEAMMVTLMTIMLTMAGIVFIIAIGLQVINLVIMSKPRSSSTPYIVMGVINIAVGGDLLVGILMLVYGVGRYFEKE